MLIGDAGRPVILGSSQFIGAIVGLLSLECEGWAFVPEPEVPLSGDELFQIGAKVNAMNSGQILEEG